MRLNWRGIAQARKRRKQKHAEQAARERAAENRSGRRQLQRVPQGRQTGASAAFARTFKGITGRQSDRERFRTLTDHHDAMPWAERRRRAAAQKQREAVKRGVV